MHRHFDAINAANREAFRETAFLFEENDGQPFERWWEDLRSLAPFTVTVTPAPQFGQKRNTTKISTWVQVTAHCPTGTFTDNFVVYFLLDSQAWKVGCRMHWRSDSAFAAAVRKAQADGESWV
jgi:hypothetical protein